MKRLSEMLSGQRRFRLSAFFSLGLLLMVLVLSGCTTEKGTRVSSVSFVKLKPGISTMADVRSVIGPPDRVEQRFGEQVWVYRHRVTKGLFYRHTTGKNIVIYFDEKGVIRQIRSTSVDTSEAF
jgi:outer membrane protein assembly factor BamE (lipoprotein component of BamABCDE complex)